jgi:hypothetical protein
MKKKSKKVKIAERYFSLFFRQNRFGLFLVQLRTPDAVIGFFESHGLPHRTIRADTSLFIKHTARTFSYDAKHPFICRSHAFVI